MKDSKRNIPIQFFVTPEERNMIMGKLAQCGGSNLSAYLRKMAIDGYVIKLDLPELREISSLLRQAGNNINQIAKRANETRRVYDTDLQEITRMQEKVMEDFGKVLTALAKLE